MNDEVPIQDLDILQSFREDLRQYLDEIVALNWRAEDNRFVLALCNESRWQLDVDIVIDAGHSLLPVLSADTEVPDYASSRYRECRVAHAGHAVMLVQDIIDRYGLDSGSVRNGCFCFFRSDAMKEKVEALRRSNGWLVCGNYPVVSNTIYLPASFDINPATQKRLAELIYADLEWRQDILFCQSAGGADEIELEILQQRQPGLRFWNTAKLDYPMVMHYLRWDSHDRGALPLDSQYNSCLDLMCGLEKTEADFVFSLSAGGEDKVETIRSFIQEVYQEPQAGAQAREKIVL